MISYIARHWRGEFSLAHSYWVNGVVIGLPFNIYFRVVRAMMDASPPQSPTWVVLWLYLPLAIWLPVAFWQGIGIWRSAGNAIAANRKFWAWVARVVMMVALVNFAIVAGVLAKYGYALTNSAIEEANAKYDVRVEKNIVFFHGEITLASVNALEPLLRRKSTDRLVIRSIGGFVRPALRLAGIVHERQLRVVVPVECDSACVMVLAAAKDRLVTPETVIGMHASTIEGVRHADFDLSGDEDKFYRGAGVTPEFLKKIRKYGGPASLYYPTLHEELAQGLATDVFDEKLGGYVPAADWCGAHQDTCERSGLANLKLQNAKSHD